jgi:diacylglycerol kinase family enzyme
VQVKLLARGQDVASVARLAIDEGAQVLGAAGGDGTISAVAAVAADSNRPLVVIPAGTRNHFARDLGLDITSPVPAVNAFVDGELARVDLGRVGSRTFVNNVCFGAYADALLTPGYREAKVRTLAAMAPGYLQGERSIPASLDTPEGTVEHPQLVLVSNNGYHLATPRYFGRRFSLATGLLGGILLKLGAPPPPPELLRRLRLLLRDGRQGGVMPPDEAAITWSAARITLNGTVAKLPAGIDGESVLLDLPVVCEIRPAALQILLPTGRPGLPPEPIAPGHEA